MKYQRICAAMLSAALLCGTLPAAVAAEQPVATTVANTVTAAETQSILPERSLDYGTITQLVKEDGALQSFVVERVGEKGTIVYHVSRDTLYLDSGKAIPATANDLVEGMGVYVYRSPIETLSLPPQTNAEAVVINIPQDAGCAKLHTVEAITQTQDGISVLTDRGSLYVYAKSDAKISPWMTKNIARMEDLRIGSRFFAWYDVVAESYPGQAWTERIVILPARTDNQYAIVIDGDMVLGETVSYQNGVPMVPLRAVAEALGANVSWNQGTRSATITDRVRTMTLTTGQDLYTSAATGSDGLTAPQALGAAPMIDASGRMWVPAEAFSVLQGYTVSLANGQMSIAPQA